MKIKNLKNVFNSSPYKNFKLYRELWKKTESYDLLTSFPLHLDIELSGVCNLKCDFCFQNGLIKEPLGLMKYSLFKKIIDEGTDKGLCAIKLQVRGESFLNPKLFECISYAKKKGVMDVQLTTNGTFLSEENINKILDSELDIIILSVDSNHESSYDKKYEKKSYSIVEQNIKRLLNIRNQKKQKRPWVRLKTSVFENKMDVYQKAKNDIKKSFSEADAIIISRIHNLKNDMPAYPDLFDNYIMEPCSYLMQRLTIFWNGDITVCCMDYNNQFQLGNIYNNSIEDIWMSDKLNRFRLLHANNKRKSMEICKNCHACIISNNENTFVDDTKRHFSDYNCKSVIKNFSSIDDEAISRYKNSILN